MLYFFFFKQKTAYEMRFSAWSSYWCSSVLHHVETHAAHTRHMVQHDAIAPLGHDGQFVAALVGPHAKTKKTQAQRIADIFDLFQMSSGFGAGFMKIVEGRSGKFQLAGRFQADRAIGPGKRNDHPVLHHTI